MKTIVNAPWGKYAITDKDGKPDWIACLDGLIAQLKYIQVQGNNRTVYLQRDIRGYQELRKRNDPDLIRRFLDMKTANRNAGVKKDNLEVLAHMDSLS
jgi:hypothetical protein